MEQERTNALREQLQGVNQHLTNVVREVKDRSGGIINECETLIQGVIGANAQVVAPGGDTPSEGSGKQSGVGRGAQSRGAPTRRSQRGGFQRGSSSASRGPCGYCGKPNHTEDNYWKKEGKCLRCGSADHQLATCPILKQDGKGSQTPPKSNSGPAKMDGKKPKVSARVYSLEPQQVPDSSEVVEGTIPIFHRFAKVLVDPGATHSFVNPNFMFSIDIKSASLPYDLEVSMPTGDHCLITSMVYKDCEVWVGERKLLGNLISLSIKGYDVILGMDWLARYNAQLDCKKKVVEFRIPGETTLRLDIRGRLASSALISGSRGLLEIRSLTGVLPIVD
ncbi:uncharacterized protein LOC113759210 [Coffea eugenioides]|uniref:uncharacterized protein LOC113759210 n=1 Tax=Coffea eugenioides TaxID=49369 RepID=UPI000F612884|nr:uncharacterized protein LOC113759210 [Coffea eugenioides]